VLGATELPLVKPLVPLKSPSPPKKSSSTLGRFAARPIPAGQPVKLVGHHPARLLPNLAALQQTIPLPKVSVDKPAMALMALASSETEAQPDEGAVAPRIEIDGQQIASTTVPQGPSQIQSSPKVARSTTRLGKVRSHSKKGPQIEAMTNAASYNSAAVTREAPAYMAESSTVAPAASPESAMPLAEPSSAEVQPPAQTSQASAPEPAYQVLMALPRYQGGAPPIQAMTLDSDGNPIVVHPKNAPIREFNVEDRNGGYNTLFQADTPTLDSQQDKLDTLMNEALSKYREQEYTDAEQDIRQALQLDHANADLYAALAEIQLKQNDLDSAMQSYQQASQLSAGKYGPAYVQLLVQAGKRQEAIRMLEEMNQEHPQQEQIVYMLGTLHEELGQVGQALVYLKQAAQLHPASADIQYNLGLAYELLGDREQAEKHYRSALTLSPKAPDIAKALERVRN
jgi:Flp pilus assembly protein TadD